VTPEVGLDKINMPMGANFGDVDNDGFLDIFLATGGQSTALSFPKCFFATTRENLSWTLLPRRAPASSTKSTAWPSLTSATMAEDILVSIGGATPGDAHAFRVFQNPGNGNDWITVKLVGVRTNRSAIGARIHLTVEMRVSLRGSFIGPSGAAVRLALHRFSNIWLGKSAKSAIWEIGGQRAIRNRSFEFGINQFIEIKEFAKDYIKLQRRSFRLGSTNRRYNLPNPDAQKPGANRSSPQEHL